MLTETWTRRARRLEDIQVAHDERPTGDDAERRPVGGEVPDAGPREAVATLGRLIGVGRGADDDLVAGPGGPAELGGQDLGDVHLDPHRAAVAVVPGAIGPGFERAHVAERAAVSTAHVGIQGPGKGHAPDGIERRPTGFLAEDRAHGPQDRQIGAYGTSVQSRAAPSAMSHNRYYVNLRFT
jgi:hypothetical protein